MPTTSVRFQIATVDGAPLPGTARLCLEGQGVAVCQSLAPVAQTFATTTTRLTIMGTTPSSITVEASNLPPGEYLVRLTGLAPYADITAPLVFADGALVIQPIVLTHAALPEPQPTLAAFPTPSTTPPDRAAPNGSPEAPAATDPLVTKLPNTGATPGHVSTVPILLILLATLLAGLASYRHRRHERLSPHIGP